MKKHIPVKVMATPAFDSIFNEAFEKYADDDVIEGDNLKAFIDSIGNFPNNVVSLNGDFDSQIPNGVGNVLFEVPSLDDFGGAEQLADLAKEHLPEPVLDQVKGVLPEGMGDLLFEMPSLDDLGGLEQVVDMAKEHVPEPVLEHAKGVLPDEIGNMLFEVPSLDDLGDMAKEHIPEPVLDTVKGALPDGIGNLLFEMPSLDDLGGAD
jgi:hypothetical protein